MRQEALLSYADALPVVGAGGQSSADLVEVTDQTTYLALTVGDISGTLKLLESEQSQLAGTVASPAEQLESALESEGSAASGSPGWPSARRPRSRSCWPGRSPK